jgi:ferredoxin-thioredoxin reductase catalytic subunit
MPKKELSEEEAFESTVKFSERYVDRGPYEFFPEKEVVEEVQKGLANNHRIEGYRYCP